MTERSESLAARVQSANDGLLTAVESSTPEQWKAPSENAPWTQGFVAYHAGSSIGNIAAMIRGMASGAPFQPVTFEQIDQMNAGFHAEHANCTKQETLEAIRANSPVAVDFVRGLSDEQLDRRVALAVGIPEMPIAQVIEMLLIGHTTDHTASIANAR